MKGLSRRGLLLGSAVAGAALLPGLRASAAGAPALARAIRADRPLHRTLARLGHACARGSLALGATERAALEADYRAASASAVPLACWLDELARRDFRTGDTVELDRWVLARSEVELILYASALPT